MTHLQRQVIDAAVALSREKLAAGETANLTADELARHLGRAGRPVGGCCSALTRAGYLERVAAATYRLTTPGLSALRQQPGYPTGARILVARDHDGRIPAEAQVTAKDPSRPHLIRVVYAESRRGAWIARDRILGPPPRPPRGCGRHGQSNNRRGARRRGESRDRRRRAGPRRRRARAHRDWSRRGPRCRRAARTKHQRGSRLVVTPRARSRPAKRWSGPPGVGGRSGPYKTARVARVALAAGAGSVVGGSDPATLDRDDAVSGDADERELLRAGPTTTLQLSHPEPQGSGHP